MSEEVKNRISRIISGCMTRGICSEIIADEIMDYLTLNDLLNSVAQTVEEPARMQTGLITPELPPSGTVAGSIPAAIRKELMIILKQLEFAEDKQIAVWSGGIIEGGYTTWNDGEYVVSNSIKRLRNLLK